VCDKCGKRRDPKFFGADKRRTDGISTRCVACLRTRRSSATRAVRLQDTYGITAEDYKRLLEAQGGCCAICGGKRSYNLDVDHDHALEKAGSLPRQTVRGLLCKQCNRRILRSVRDDVSVLRNAIAYLENPPAQTVLGFSMDRAA
jgi:Recombination endonuclease VII